MGHSFRAGKYRLELGKSTYVMGILDLSPEEDGQAFLPAEAAVSRAWEMAAVGADMIGVSAQPLPGDTAVPEEQQLAQLLPLLAQMEAEFSIPVCVETELPAVATACLKAGASVICSAEGFADPAMVEAVAASPDCGVLLVHHTACPDGEETVESVRQFFRRRIDTLNAAGVASERVCLDPGVGLGKSYEQNLQLLANADQLRVGDCCTCMSTSRKRVIAAACGNPPFEQRMPGTVAADSVAQFCGVDMVRAHDVIEAVQGARVVSEIRRFRRK